MKIKICIKYKIKLYYNGVIYVEEKRGDSYRRF